MNLKRNIGFRKKSEEREKRKTDAPEVERDIYHLIRLITKKLINIENLLQGEGCRMKNRLFMEPGKTNKEDRENFVKLWAAYMKSVDDAIRSRQQNVIINSQVKNARNFYGDLAKSEEGRRILERLKIRMGKRK